MSSGHVVSLSLLSQGATGPTLPEWSPFAVAAGAIVGFLLGAIASALYALWLIRPRPTSRRLAVRITADTAHLRVALSRIRRRVESLHRAVRATGHRV